MERFYSRHAKRIYSVALRVLRDPTSKAQKIGQRAADLVTSLLESKHRSHPSSGILEPTLVVRAATGSTILPPAPDRG